MTEGFWNQELEELEANAKAVSFPAVHTLRQSSHLQPPKLPKAPGRETGVPRWPQNQQHHAALGK